MVKNCDYLCSIFILIPLYFFSRIYSCLQEIWFCLFQTSHKAVSFIGLSFSVLNINESLKLLWVAFISLLISPYFCILDHFQYIFFKCS